MSPSQHPSLTKKEAAECLAARCHVHLDEGEASEPSVTRPAKRRRRCWGPLPCRCDLCRSVLRLRVDARCAAERGSLGCSLTPPAFAYVAVSSPSFCCWLLVREPCAPFASPFARG